ncbi:hypothetical protein AB0M54_14870 [Actinoplanes sp. NPDC051470]|uniref:hypothetical protein n=1 Tax=Actinoplanes sp. NPDC051470 TaxID=3157224 RepID=UPI0034454624
MEDHEYLAPHPGVVYARVQLLSRIYRRRRMIMQSAGSAVLGAGLLVGLVQMHGFIQGDAIPSAQAPGVGTFVSAPPPLPPPSPSVTPSEPHDPDEPERNAYFAAGYGWEEAEKLAALWNLEDPAEAKVKAGARLLDGKRLPFRPFH